jgi:aspartyl-tRNA(Asn)/glutamyl-tRNA(Gln) amidotransferase subunit B
VNPQTVIGLEIHAQLRTRSKAFCGCSTAETAEPNTQTCPVCLGHPGTLPVLNAAMPRAAVLIGRALGCSIRPESTFSRKHYFYPDLVKGYQITQFRDPICEEGKLTYRRANGKLASVRITRIHMEEDAARLKHTDDATLVDYNRAGHPLLEIVTAPEFSQPADAAAFVKALRQLLRYLGICDGDMERGSLRCDANISLRLTDGSTSARSEIKNLNSFRGVERALAWEDARQRALLAEGQRIESATLLWDEDAGTGRVMRGKESAEEYHYLPEPDLPPVLITEDMIATADQALPELPWKRRERFENQLGLPALDAEVLTAERGIADYFENVLAHCTEAADSSLPSTSTEAPHVSIDAATTEFLETAKTTANWVMGIILRDMRARGNETPDVPPARLAELLTCIRQGIVSTSAAKEVLPALRVNPDRVENIIDEMGLRQLRDTAAIRAIVDRVLAEHPKQLAQYHGGKQQLLGFFVGQVMQHSGGAADPTLVRSLLEAALSDTTSRRED